MDPIDPHHKRQDIRDRVRAAVAGWLDLGDMREHLAILADLARNDDDGRVRRAAAEGAAKIQLQIAELAQRIGEADDKTSRLDAGEATERTTFVVDVPRVGKLTKRSNDDESE